MLLISHRFHVFQLFLHHPKIVVIVGWGCYNPEPLFAWNDRTLLTSMCRWRQKACTFIRLACKIRQKIQFWCQSCCWLSLCFFFMSSVFFQPKPQLDSCREVRVVSPVPHVRVHILKLTLTNFWPGMNKTPNGSGQQYKNIQFLY